MKNNTAVPAAPFVSPLSSAAMERSIAIVQETYTTRRLMVQIYAAVTRFSLTQVSTMMMLQTRLQHDRPRLIFCLKMELVCPIISRMSLR